MNKRIEILVKSLGRRKAWAATRVVVLQEVGGYHLRLKSWCWSYNCPRNSEMIGSQMGIQVFSAYLLSTAKNRSNKRVAIEARLLHYCRYRLWSVVLDLKRHWKRMHRKSSCTRRAWKML